MADDRIIIPKTLRCAALNALHFGPPEITKCVATQLYSGGRICKRTFKKPKTCSACLSADKNLKFQIPQTGKTNIEPPKTTGEEIQLDFTANIHNQKLPPTPFISIAVDKNSRRPVAKGCKNTNHETVNTFLNDYITVFGVPKRIKSDKGSAFIPEE